MSYPLRRPSAPTSLAVAVVAAVLLSAGAAAAAARTPGDSSTAARREPVPSDAAQKRAAAAVHELFRDEYRSQEPVVRRKLAGRLVDEARNAANDAPTRFVLLHESGTVAAAAGDLNTAWTAAEEAGRSFDVDPLDVKAGFLRAAKGAPAQGLEYRLKLADEAATAERFDLASSVMAEAQKLLRGNRDRKLAERLKDQAREIDRRQAESRNLAAALKKLETEPADAEANLTAGRILCLRKGQWEKGLPLLARGSDAALAELARSELMNPSDEDGKLWIAEAWQAQSRERKKSPLTAGQALAMLARVRHWYERALESSSGVSRKLIEKRLTELGAEPPQSGDGPSDVDLLAKIDPARDAWSGRWERTADGLASDDGLGSRVRIPYQPPEEYDFRVQFTRHGGDGLVAPILWHPKASFFWGISGEKDFICGFENVGGKNLSDNVTSKRYRTPFVNGERHTVVVRVRRGGLETLFDGKIVTQHRTDFSDMRLNDYWKIGEDTLGIATHGSRVTFHVIELAEVSGRGRDVPRPARR